jgi:hypothetical protein
LTPLAAFGLSAREYEQSQTCFHPSPKCTCTRVHLRLILVRPMRNRSLFVGVFVILAHLTPMLAAGGGPATRAYQKRVRHTAMMRVGGALIPYFHEIQRAGSGTIVAHFRLREAGRADDVKVTQRHPFGLANSIASRVISSTQFPPIPSQVIHEQRHPYVDITFELPVN